MLDKIAGQKLAGGKKRDQDFDDLRVFSKQGIIGATRPATPRKTFSTCRFYTKDSPLLDSGLLGPVQLRFAVREMIDFE